MNIATNNIIASEHLVNNGYGNTRQDYKLNRS